MWKAEIVNAIRKLYPRTRNVELELLADKIENRAHFMTQQRMQRAQDRPPDDLLDYAIKVVAKNGDAK